ncbi:hypothetical protein BOTBODRAFT_352762 [Botryobasidium botryosum FD-172 SS1]|uniref:Uncharacterized protein n=1 Tax=Botryobasidium botryosum (strain FD-172 SS1) TaxID=930990 RepID=A0A067MHJ3_BOTB1|nr:hypothetical protein BOTBODRAFT_352762 [Botryobasidium botryosum FD-172 SS1]
MVFKMTRLASSRHFQRPRLCLSSTLLILESPFHRPCTESSSREARDLPIDFSMFVQPCKRCICALFMQRFSYATMAHSAFARKNGTTEGIMTQLMLTTSVVRCGYPSSS